MTPTQLSNALNQSAESVCRHLLPRGKRKGSEWVIGNTEGEEGDSLKVVIEGDKVGVGSDFATGEVFGDLLDLWCATQQVHLGAAMAQACTYLGIVPDGRETAPKREYAKPPRPKLVKRLNPEGQVAAYLKGRGLTDIALEDFRIAEEDGQWIVFPYLRDDQHLNTKYLHLDRKDGKKSIRQEKNAEPCLFGWHALEKRYPKSRMVVLTEGEADAITYHQCGIPSLSVPNGGGGGKKQDWIDNDYDHLNRFDTIYLSLDNDEAGKEAEKEIIRRLGSERCRVVTLPHKDANECFAHGIKDFSRYLHSARVLDPDELKAADYFTDSVLLEFYPPPGAYQGMKTPWNHLNEVLRFNRPELIVWSGYNGSGKSEILSQVAVQGLLDGERFAICSLEIPGRKTLKRIVRKLLGEEQPTLPRIREAMDWLKDKLWIVDIVGTAKQERLLKVYQYATRRYDIHNFITDSLTKVGVSEESFDQQKEFVDQLCDFGHKHECINHLVVHQRKTEHEGIKPGKFGVRGAGAITDEADTVITTWRFMEEEQNKYSKKKTNDFPEDNPDSILSVVKNRENGQLGSFKLYFNPDSLQFHESRQPSVNYLAQHHQNTDPF